jgi:hypothetical protein
MPPALRRIPGRPRSRINLFDVLAHTWDIAVATGVVLDCADDLWQAGLDTARVVIRPGRDRCTPVTANQLNRIAFGGELTYTI